MSNIERQLGVVKDLLLPTDIHTRYDVYFTDQRIAIVCLGKANRFEIDTPEKLSFVPEAFGVPPPLELHGEETSKRQTIDEETKNWPLSELLTLSKKSCFYTNDEIEEIKLIARNKPKFEILSKECESIFAPNMDQFFELCIFLSSIETLRNKLSIAGKWNTLQEIFRTFLCEQDKKTDCTIE